MNPEKQPVCSILAVYMCASECLTPRNDVCMSHVKEALGNITLFFFMNCDSTLIPGTLSQAHPKRIYRSNGRRFDLLITLCLCVSVCAHSFQSGAG